MSLSSLQDASSLVSPSSEAFGSFPPRRVLRLGARGPAGAAGRHAPWTQGKWRRAPAAWRHLPGGDTARCSRGGGSLPRGPPPAGPAALPGAAGATGGRGDPLRRRSSRGLRCWTGEVYKPLEHTKYSARYSLEVAGGQI